MTRPPLPSRYRWWFFLLLLAGAGALGYGLGQRHGGARVQAVLYDGRGPFRAVDANPGPWGRIRHYPIVLQYPRNRIDPQPAADAESWFIPEPQSTNLVSFLTSCGWPDEQARQLADTAQREAGIGCRLYPPRPLVIAMKPALRARFYTALGGWPENGGQYQPIFFPDTYPVRELAQRRLPKPLADLLSGLLYTYCEQVTFADLQTLFSGVTDEDTRVTLMQILTGEVSLMPNLIVEAHDDVPALIRYWGVGGREEQVRSLLEATQLAKGYTTVPLGLLLPAFPRTRLFRYRMDEDGPQPDCLYTALNFFNAEPDARLQQPAAAEQEFRDRYQAIPEEERMPGDVILIQSQAGHTLHACNYLCDDLVFTKNGNTLVRPWVIQHLRDVVRIYACREPVTLAYLRRIR